MGGVFSFRQRRKCHIWTCTAAGLGKGQGIGRREVVGWEAQHRPADVRQMADLAAGQSQSNLQAFSAAGVHNTTLLRGCQPSLAGLLGGGLHTFKHPAAKRQHQRCFMGNSASEKGCLGSGEKWEGRQRDCPWLLFTSLPSLHTGPHRQLRAGSPCADLPTLPSAQGPQAATLCPPHKHCSLETEKNGKLT